MKRELEIDAARGLMLAWMTLTHLPTALTPWVNQPFGYISASEGFIFLSALFTGRIYHRLLTRDGLPKMSSTLWLRTLRLYGYHLLLLIVAILISAYFTAVSHGQGLRNLLDFYFAANHGRAILDAVFLLYRPPLLDIVPLYIIFLLLAPVLIFTASRFGWKPLIGISFVVWLTAQFGLREALYSVLVYRFGLRVPLNEMGAFNLWAWQLVWVLGVWAGVRWAKNDLPVENFAKRLWVPAAFIAAALLALRYWQIFGLDLGRLSVLFDKWQLGVVRLINFTAVAVLLIQFRAFVKPLAIRPLVLLGQSSLQVFCTHFVFCFIGIGMMGSAARIYGWPQFALIALTFAALLIVAKLHAKPEPAANTSPGREPRPPVLPPVSPPASEFTRAA